MLSRELGGTVEHFEQGYSEARVSLGKPKAAFQGMLWDILSRHGDPRPIRSKARNVTLLRHRDKEGEEYIFAINLNAVQPERVEMEVPGKFTACLDLILNGCPVPVITAFVGASSTRPCLI